MFASRLHRITLSALCVALSSASAQTVGTAQADSVSENAAASLGQSESVVLTLVRELTEWKKRALTAEERLGVQVGSEPARAISAAVVGTLDGERVIILSVGRSQGAVQGALVTIGEGVVAKVVEARDSVCAALVENSYKGSLAKLEGLPVRLSVRF